MKKLLRTLLSLFALATVRVNAFPNLTTTQLTITLESDRFDRFEVINLIGAVVMNGTLLG